ncbi:hypothetical protein HAX54_035273 [Datura stramonium]|uniref:Vacuolar iron transporter n=1 Tax=Datura stramonium TaxID=4076 RepID=A0ABS8RLX6_DATST|nr:hypothetical protein [Datura stramonium]
MAAQNQVQITIPKDHDDQNHAPEEDFDYSQRAQWLRAAVLGANDGLVSIASLMMSVGAVQENVKTMILTGFAGLVVGACSMAIGEFVSVYSQLDIERAQMKRDQTIGRNQDHEEGELALVAFGGIGAFLGRSPVVKSCPRVLIGGWMAMAITFGITTLIGSTGPEM